MATSRIDSGVRHTLGPYEVTVATGFGPRIVGLRRQDSPEILVELAPDVGIAGEGGRFYRFRGGHRLWVSPEVPEVSHASDDHRCAVVVDTDMLRITSPVDSAGFGKQLDIHWDGRRLVVDHVLRWSGEELIQAAPWAVTQLPLGGTAILPIGGSDHDPAFQADASLVLWPYTRLDDPRVSWLSRVVLIRAEAGPENKLGSGPSPGGLGYLRDGYLFVKHFEAAGGRPMPEHGAVGQVYFGEHFCELESVGELVTLEPGSTARHREVWAVSACPDVETAIESVRHRGRE